MSTVRKQVLGQSNGTTCNNSHFPVEMNVQFRLDRFQFDRVATSCSFNLDRNENTFLELIRYQFSGTSQCTEIHLVSTSKCANYEYFNEIYILQQEGFETVGQTWPDRSINPSQFKFFGNV
jgi:hypothetical protein